MLLPFRSPYLMLKHIPVLLLTSVLGLYGCITVSAVQHRIRVNPDGSGIAAITFLDLRSDAADDSAYSEDLDLLLDILAREKIEEFEKDGKKILKKGLTLNGDTLSLRVEYEFRDLQSIDGIRISDDEIFFVVGESKRIIGTNGKIKDDSWGDKRMVWKTDARQFSYLIEDVDPPKGRSLSQAYRFYLQESEQ